MPRPFVSREVFSDFEQLKERTPQWSLDWRQLDPGPLEASVAQVATGSVLVSHSVFNRAFESPSSGIGDSAVRPRPTESGVG